MKREDLETLGIEKEAIDKVMALHQKELQPIKTELDEKKVEVETLTNTAAETKKQISEMEKNVGDNETLRQQFEEYKENAEKEAKTLKTDLDKQKLNALIDEEITKAGGKKKIVKALINIDELMQSNDRSTDVVNAIKSLSEDEETKILFQAQKTGNADVGADVGGGTPPKPPKVPSQF